MLHALCLCLPSLVSVYGPADYESTSQLPGRVAGSMCRGKIPLRFGWSGGLARFWACHACDRKENLIHWIVQIFLPFLWGGQFAQGLMGEWKVYRCTDTGVWGT